MSKNLIGHLKLPAICILLGFVSACSTVDSKQVSAIEAKANSAISEARSAASTAQNAMKAAEAAQAAADAAAATAAEAKSTAEAAMSCCNENKDRIERMFEQTMKK
ncbi:MAG: alanine-zipper protein [Gammaproteobacteria bacterium]|nr:alanine-zipper protein [Gammaproteobacteria bacterium]